MDEATSLGFPSTQLVLIGGSNIWTRKMKRSSKLGMSKTANGMECEPLELNVSLGLSLLAWVYIAWVYVPTRLTGEREGEIKSH